MAMQMAEAEESKKLWSNDSVRESLSMSDQPKRSIFKMLATMVHSVSMDSMPALPLSPKRGSRRWMEANYRPKETFKRLDEEGDERPSSQLDSDDEGTNSFKRSRRPRRKSMSHKPDDSGKVEPLNPKLVAAIKQKTGDVVSSGADFLQPASSGGTDSSGSRKPVSSGPDLLRCTSSGGTDSSGSRKHGTPQQGPDSSDSRKRDTPQQGAEDALSPSAPRAQHPKPSIRRRRASMVEFSDAKVQQWRERSRFFKSSNDLVAAASSSPSAPQCLSEAVLSICTRNFGYRKFTFGKAYDVIPGFLRFAAYRDQMHRITSTDGYVGKVRFISSSLATHDKVAPVSLAQIHRLCHSLHKLLSEESKFEVVYCVDNNHPLERTNAILILASYLVLVHKLSPDDAMRPFEGLPEEVICEFPFQTETLISGGFQEPPSGLTFYEILLSIQKANEEGMVSYEAFNIKFYESLRHLKLGKICQISSKLVLLHVDDPGEFEAKGAERLKQVGVTSVIRVNNREAYDSSSLTQNGLKHFEYEFTSRKYISKNVVQAFLADVENESGAVAVTSHDPVEAEMLAGTWLIKKHGFSSWGAFAWMHSICDDGLDARVVRFLEHFERGLCKRQANDASQDHFQTKKSRGRSTEAHTTQHSTTQHSTTQHSTTQHSTPSTHKPADIDRGRNSPSATQPSATQPSATQLSPTQPLPSAPQPLNHSTTPPPNGHEDGPPPVSPFRARERPMSPIRVPEAEGRRSSSSSWRDMSRTGSDGLDYLQRTLEQAMAAGTFKMPAYGDLEDSNAGALGRTSSGIIDVNPMILRAPSGQMLRRRSSSSFSRAGSTIARSASGRSLQQMALLGYVGDNSDERPFDFYRDPMEIPMQQTSSPLSAAKGCSGGRREAALSRRNSCTSLGGLG